MKLFPKLAWTVSLLLVGTIGCLTLCFYWTEQRHLRREAGLERQTILHNLVHIAQESFLSNDDLLLVKYTHWLAKWHPSMISASIVDLRGAILAHSEPSKIGGQDKIQSPFASKMLVLSDPVRLGPRWVGTASLAFSEKEMEETLRGRLLQLQRRLAILVTVSLVLGLGICLRIASSWTRPIAALSHTAEKVGQGDWTVDLKDLSRRGDELGFLARSFEEMTEKLRQLDELKEDFVSAVTHELRSPLGAIESYLNLISQELHEGISVAAWENYLERLRINTQRLTRFVNDLLDIAAIERGKVRLESRFFDVVAMAQDVLGLFALKLREKGIAYEVSGHPNASLVFADPDKIRQVLVNLVSNAIKFTPPAGIVRIHIEDLISEGSIRVSVVDTGVGIAEADQSRIFSKFEQVRSARSHVQGTKGTGLGLSICKALLDLHNRELSVRSECGKGSHFSFTLPIADKTAELAAKQGR